MKKSALVFVLASCAAAAAEAQTMQPLWDVKYYCNYSSPWFNEVDPGWTIFTNKRTFPNVTYGIELYQATTSTGQDNRRIAFSSPQDICRRDPETGDCEVVATSFQFSVVQGPQCTRAVVREWGHRITFTLCSNGLTRTCTTY